MNRLRIIHTLCLCTFIHGLTTLANAATPAWTETFASLTGGTKYNGTSTALATISLPSGDWGAWNELDNGINYIGADSTFAIGTLPSATTVVPPENDHRIIFGNATGASTQLRSAFATGVDNWKYDMYLGIPATTNQVGNITVGVTVNNGSGQPKEASNPLFHLQVALDVTTNLQWRVRTSANGNANTAAPVAMPAVKANVVDRWWKLTFERDAVNKKFIGYINDVKDYEYAYGTLYDTSTLILSDSMVQITAFSANNANFYIDDVKFCGGDSVVEDWSAQ